MRVALASSLVFISICLAGAGEMEPIVIKLRATAMASGSKVTIGDIADLQGIEGSQSDRVARLDLAELPLSSQPILVSQQQIGFRLQLAGLAASAYRLEGPRYVRVSRPAGEGLEAKIAVAAKQALQEKLASPSEDVTISLAQAVSLPPLSAEGADIHLEAAMRSPVMPPCRVGVEVVIYVRGARRNGVIVYLDVKKLEPVPVALRRIEIGEAFGPDNVRLERLAVEDTQKAIVSAAGLIGRRARRVVPAGHTIEAADVETDTPAAIVIQANDLVHLVASVGPLQVKTRGEAMQSGRVGQLIQVRNLDSKATVTGRVVDRSTVEVEY